MMAIEEQTVLEFLHSLPGLDVSRDGGDADFFFYDPQRDTPHNRRQPFATVVRADKYDSVTRFHPGVFRVNLGVGRETYRSLFGPEPGWGKNGGPVETGHDFSTLDTFLPHPIYAPMSWICILNPSEDSWTRLQRYALEAHEIAKANFERTRGHPPR